MLNNQTEETALEFALRVASEVRVDINLDYMEENGIQYDNHEITSSGIPLFTTQSTKAAFDLVTSL